MKEYLKKRTGLAASYSGQTQHDADFACSQFPDDKGRNVSRKVGLSPLSCLTRPTAREHFIQFSRRENFKL
jgi:hypothetical protein